MVVKAEGKVVHVQIMKTHGRVKVQLHSLLTLAQEGGVTMLLVLNGCTLTLVKPLTICLKQIKEAWGLLKEVLCVSQE